MRGGLWGWPAPQTGIVRDVVSCHHGWNVPSGRSVRLPDAGLTLREACRHTRKAGSATALANCRSNGSDRDEYVAGQVPLESRGRCKPGGNRATEWPREPNSEPRPARSSSSGNAPVITAS